MSGIRDLIHARLSHVIDVCTPCFTNHGTPSKKNLQRVYETAKQAMQELQERIKKSELMKRERDELVQDIKFLSALQAHVNYFLQDPSCKIATILSEEQARILWCNTHTEQREEPLVQQGSLSQVVLKTYLGAQYVLKKPHAYYQTSQRALEDERSILLGLKHPHVVKLILGTQKPYLLLEYCPQGALNEYLERGVVLDVNNILGLLHQITSGLSYVHACHIIHRDLKPANVFVTEAQRLVIGDFGLAITLSEEEDAEGFKWLNETAIVGTLDYAPPEWFFRSNDEKKIQIFPVGDVWALGAIAFWLAINRCLSDYLLQDSTQFREFYRGPLELIRSRVDKALEQVNRGRLLDPYLPLLKELLEKTLVPIPQERVTAAELEQWLGTLTL